MIREDLLGYGGLEGQPMMTGMKFMSPKKFLYQVRLRVYEVMNSRELNAQ
jgi:hypothetical protein